jgi:hypothetical protein
MSDTTLTHDNLLAIYEAMLKIKRIDRSKYFDKYFNEVANRLEEIKFLYILIEDNERNK